MVRAAVATVVIVVGLVSAGSAAARANAAAASPARSDVNPGEIEDFILGGIRVFTHSSGTIAAAKIAANRTLDQTASVLATGSFTDVQAALKALWESDDFYKNALVGGLCTEMYDLSQHPFATHTWGSWHSFLIQWARRHWDNLLLPFDVRRAKAAVNTLMKSWDIASASPGDLQSYRTAWWYWQACK